ncbi:MAG TPA: LPS assembly protein LptD [Terriglobales bacterium]|nr:LPS assembly protein LptD [Terriglobales bacterium]
MITRSRIFITAALVCHLLLASGIVTSQTLPPASPTVSAQESAPVTEPALPAAPGSQTEEPVTIRAVQQEKDGSIYHLRGEAEIDYRTYILRADQITYNSDTGDSELEGHVVLDGGPYDEHVVASHGTYNIRTQVGTFYSVIGTVGMQMRKSRYVLTTSNPFAFTGKIVEKHGPDHYLVRQGTVTTCELPHPKWLFDAKRISVDVDGTAKIYNSDFQLMGMPVFYFPFVSYPVQKQRQSGLLIPTFGSSSTKGYIAGESMYWAINRSMDALVGTDYYSKRGWFERGEFRARPSDSSYVFFNYVGMVDRGIGYPPQNQGGEDARFMAERAIGTFRGVANVDYLSSFVFRLAFTDVYTQAIDSEVRSQIFLSNTTNGFHLNGLAERYQNFEVCVPPPVPEPGTCSTITQTELVRILHTPSFFLSGEERQLGNTPLYWSFESAAEGLQRREIGFRTGPIVGRFDLAPSLTMPVQWQGWSFRPELTLRDTFYTEQGNATTSTTAADDILNRKSLETSVEVRPPALSRVFDRPWLGRKWKHVIEPRMKYDYVVGINNFANILRFDAADVLTNTNEVEYSVVNRLYAKRVDPNAKDCDVLTMSTLTIGGPPQVGVVPWEVPPKPDAQICASGPREILSWEIGQKYFFDPTFGNALVVGQRNVFTTTADFTGTAFLDSERRFAPLISRLRIETSPRTNTEWDLDYDIKTGQINSSMALVNYHYGPFTIAGGDAFLRVIDTVAGTTPTNCAIRGTTPSANVCDFQQFRVLLGYGQLNKRGLSAAASFGFDADNGSLQYATAQTSYIWDCCGVNLEYRRFALGTVRNENEYRFSFTLANIGTIGNLKRQERLY